MAADKVYVQQNPRIPQHGIRSNPPALIASTQEELGCKRHKANCVQDSDEAAHSVEIVNRQDSKESSEERCEETGDKAREEHSVKPPKVPTDEK